MVLRTPRFDRSGIHPVAGLPSSPPGGPMDGELSAVPLVAVRDREAHHPGARFEVRHASAQPVGDRAGKDVKAPSDLPLADPSVAWGITGMSWGVGQGGSRGMPQLAKRDGNQGRIVLARWENRRSRYALRGVLRMLANICHRKSRSLKNPSKRWWRRRELKPGWAIRVSARTCDKMTVFIDRNAHSGSWAQSSEIASKRTKTQKFCHQLSSIFPGLTARFWTHTRQGLRWPTSVAQAKVGTIGVRRFSW